VAAAFVVRIFDRLRLPFVMFPLLLCAVAFAMPALHAHELQSAEKLVLQLKWKHQFQFAGYCVPLKKDCYRDAGFVVDIRETQDGIDPVESVLKGEAEFGVGASGLALHRARGRLEELLLAADRALDRAKNGGRNRMESATSEPISC